MKASDLRLGNTTFEYNEDDKEWIVSNVSCWDFEKARLNNDEIYIEYRKPIPITEEILLKCGFKQYMSPCDLRINICSGVLLQFHFGVNQLECWIGDEINRTDIIYLHQLQNLYWCLCGKELTVN